VPIHLLAGRPGGGHIAEINISRPPFNKVVESNQKARNVGTGNRQAVSHLNPARLQRERYVCQLYGLAALVAGGQVISEPSGEGHKLLPAGRRKYNQLPALA
jgi:hypothetical protein